MLSFGMAVAGRFDGDAFTAVDPAEDTFYRELRPVTDAFVPDAVRVSGLDRDRLLAEGAEPEAAMAEASAWVRDVSGDARPVLVGYPVVFDWMFLHWYFVRFCGASPFGFSGALDMKTMYQQKARVPLDRAGRNDLPAELRSSRPHTHNARDDAVEQGDVFARLFAWRGPAAQAGSASR